MDKIKLERKVVAFVFNKLRKDKLLNSPFGMHRREIEEWILEFTISVLGKNIEPSTERENLFCEGCVNLTSDPCKKYEKADNKACFNYKAK